MFESSQAQLLMEEVQYGNQIIRFQVIRKQRKTLGIEVHPNLSVWVISPLDVSLNEIRKRITKRGAWIAKQRNYFMTFLPRTPKKEYVSGETHLYLGRRYLLKIKINTSDSVKLIAGQMQVNTSNKIQRI